MYTLFWLYIRIWKIYKNKFPLKWYQNGKNWLNDKEVRKTVNTFKNVNFCINPFF